MTPSPKKTSVLPSGGGAVLMNPSDTVILLLDHQSGLFQTVKDIPVADLRRNVEMIARLSTLLNIPVITTASEPAGTNGPLMPEIHQLAPHAVYVPRKGEVNAWDNDDFVAQVEATGRRTLVMAGVWTSVCVMFPALDAKVAGYEVYAVVDASGDPSEMASRTSLARFVQGGVKPASTNALLFGTPQDMGATGSRQPGPAIWTCCAQLCCRTFPLSAITLSSSDSAVASGFSVGRAEASAVVMAR